METRKLVRRSVLSVLGLGALGCSAPVDHNDSGTGEATEALSGDSIVAVELREDGEVVWDKVEITVAEREEMHELDVLEASYIKARGDFTIDGFRDWLAESGHQEVLDRFQARLDSPTGFGTQEGRVRQTSQALGASTSSTICGVAQGGSAYHAELFTGTSFTGSKLCIYGSLSTTHHVDLASVAGGVFYQNVHSLKTFDESLRTYYNGGSSHDAYVPAVSAMPAASWQYAYDPGVCVGSH